MDYSANLNPLGLPDGGGSYASIHTDVCSVYPDSRWEAVEALGRLR